MKKRDFEVEYRGPVKEDAKAIVDFYNVVGGETTYLSFEKDEYPMNYEEQTADIDSVNASPNSTMLLVLVDGEIVGIGTISSTHKVKGRHVGELGIVVTQKYQAYGIGTDIMEKLIDFCRNNGVTTKITLVTRRENSNAVKLYERMGFTKEGILTDMDFSEGEYHDLFYMGRRV